MQRGPLTCLACQALPGINYQALKAAPLGLTCCAVCGYVSLRPLVHGRCPLCEAELRRFLKRQAHRVDSPGPRLAGKQSSAVAAAAAASAAAASAAAASAASLARASSFEGQRARRAHEMRRELQHSMEQVGAWIGGLVEGVKPPGVGACQLACA